jgi:hypothetical protein
MILRPPDGLDLRNLTHNPLPTCSPFTESITKRPLRLVDIASIISVTLPSINTATDDYRGGGAGMVMKVEP